VSDGYGTKSVRRPSSEAIVKNPLGSHPHFGANCARKAKYRHAASSRMQNGEAEMSAQACGTIVTRAD
jgi:hypothetical protein